MNHSRSGIRLSFSAILALAVLSACGGQAGNGTAGDSAVCSVTSCSANETWNPASCACERVDTGAPGDTGAPSETGAPPDTGAPSDTGAPHDTGTPRDAAEPPDASDATVECAGTLCSGGSVPGTVGGACVCVPVDAGPDQDRTTPNDASHGSDADAQREALDATFQDGSPPVQEASPADSYYEGPDVTYGGPGDSSPCTLACPAGQTGSFDCVGCVACPIGCPAGFEYGAECGCIPHGVDAGVDSGDAGGVACLLEGYDECAPGSWCGLGICPDGNTQYGCYCNRDGTATCQLVCPSPPPCTIPGLGTCAYNTQCFFGSCAADAGGALLCSCGYGGSASCYTYSCANDGGGIDAETPPADAGGVTCLLEGYNACSAGSWCQLGICPDGNTPYGCYCNPDGTATCDLTCPLSPACMIPGEGMCPFGTSCTFGHCTGNTGTRLSCFCGGGGFASCYTDSCSGGFEASDYFE